MTCYFLLRNFAILLASFSDILHSALVMEASHDLALVRVITNYTVTGDDVKLTFQNPRVATDTLNLKLTDIFIDQLESSPKSAVFYPIGDGDRSYGIKFDRPCYAKQFRDYKLVAPDCKFESASETKYHRATANTMPRIDCSKDDRGFRMFKVVFENDPASSFSFDSNDVTILHYAENRGTDLVALKHERVSRQYELYFGTVNEQKRFLSTYFGHHAVPIDRVKTRR